MVLIIVGMSSVTLPLSSTAWPARRSVHRKQQLAGIISAGMGGPLAAPVEQGEVVLHAGGGVGQIRSSLGL